MRVSLAISVLVLSIIGGGGSPRAWARAAPRQLLVKSKDPLVRETAAQVLGLRGSPAAVPLLLTSMVKDKNLWVRARCAEALGRIGAPDAIRHLRAALEREKNQRVRRMIAQALVRLGQRIGVQELMWQLTSGTNHAKAEVMAFLVGVTGQPLGQDVKAWWTYFSSVGYPLLALRPRAPLTELRGLAGPERRARRGPFLWGKGPAWQVVPAVVLHLRPSRRPITRHLLRRQVRLNGAIPDGCLILLRSGWREARPRRTKQGKKAATKPAPRGLARGWGGLTKDGAMYLLKQAPGLLGVGIDTPTLEPGPAAPVRDLLLSKSRLVLESLDDMDRIVASGARLLLIRSSARQGTARVLAIVP